MPDAGPVPIESAAPPTLARALAIAAILVGGLCGATIGYAFVDLQSASASSTAKAIGAVIGAIGAALGVAVIAVLVLRAMAEWRTIEHAGDPAAARRRQQEMRRRS